MRAITAVHRSRAVIMAAAMLVIAALLTVGTAQAAPSTKNYTAKISPGAVSAGVSQQQFTVVLSNCGGPVSDCPKASHQSFESANIQVDQAFSNVSATVAAAGWYVVQPVTNGLVELRSKHAALAPGNSLSVSVVADTPASFGLYTWTTAVKQANNFNGAGNNFTISGSQPQVLVGLPDHLAFVTQPSNVQVSTQTSSSNICPAPSVQVVDANGAPVTVGSAQISLLADTAHGDPALGGATSASTINGLATFGSSDCSSGVTASTLGAGYKLQATATWTFGAYVETLTTNQDSAPFDVVQLLTVCAAGSPCDGTTSGANTTASVSTSTSDTTDQLEIAVGIDSLASTTCLPYSPPAGIEVVRVFVDNRSKIVTLTFDPTVASQAPNDGNGLFRVCFSAPWGNWVTDSGTPPTFNTVTNEYEGLLPTCGHAGLLADNPCVLSRSMSAGSVIDAVSVPFQPGREDPKLW
ncbi:MAG: hypothetical protein ACRDV3_04500 [Acidothermaceae bacterium]